MRAQSWWAEKTHRDELLIYDEALKCDSNWGSANEEGEVVENIFKKTEARSEKILPPNVGQRNYSPARRAKSDERNLLWQVRRDARQECLKLQKKSFVITRFILKINRREEWNRPRLFFSLLVEQLCKIINCTTSKFPRSPHEKLSWPFSSDGFNSKNFSTRALWTIRR